mmetsp:Transcript_5516/g.13914  ORF Transcript_5516/g.13914 Transcript_5516/m.13914 type:complete len:253 (+) Transcript_5516:168-926(+)
MPSGCIYVDGSFSQSAARSNSTGAASRMLSFTADRVASMRCGRSTIENHCVASAVNGGKVMPTTCLTPAWAQLSYMRFSDLKVASASHLHKSFVPARITTAPGVLDWSSSLRATSTCPAVRSGSADTRTSTGVKMSFLSSLTTTLATGSKPPSPPATSPASSESPTMLQLKRASRRLFVLRAPAVASAQNMCARIVFGTDSPRSPAEALRAICLSKVLALVRRSVSRLEALLAINERSSTARCAGSSPARHV